jgi:exopolysaccharide biosynthesis polyprenyl glycosylphosphotransferase
MLLLGPLLTWRTIYALLLTQPAFRVRAVVLGRGRTTETLAALLGDPERHDYELIATIDYRAESRHDSQVGQRLRTLVVERNVREIAVDGGAFRSTDLGPALLELAESGVQIRTDWELYESLTGRVLLPLANPAGLGSVGSAAALYALGWRVGETVFALLGLLGLAPLIGLAALAIALDSPGGPLYWQDRVGRFGRTFRLVKLRTMISRAEADGQPVWAYQGDPRITRVGALLRRLRLDELPQLWNVLHGEMSLVGPRPERPEFVKLLEDRIPMYRARHLVRPGITGWAQVHLRYGASVQDAALKLQYDLYYVRHRTLLLDLIILLRTITVVLRLQGT